MAKILVADDNSNIQKMVGLALKDQGIEVIAVGNGEAAVRKIADLKPDLVLADVFMPVRNGYEVCKFVKDDSALSHIPVILLVGAFDPLDEQEAQRAGADGVLKKPFVPPDPLISMVKSALTRAGVVLGARIAPPPIPVAMKPAATLPRVAPLPPPTFTPEPVQEPLAPASFSARPATLTIDKRAQPLAFGSLLDTSAPEDETVFAISPSTQVAPERDWGSSAADEPEEEPDPSKTGSWRLSSIPDTVDEVPAGQKDWREGAFAGIGSEKPVEWAPSVEKNTLSITEEEAAALAKKHAGLSETTATRDPEDWAKAIGEVFPETTPEPREVLAPAINEPLASRPAPVSEPAPISATPQVSELPPAAGLAPPAPSPSPNSWMAGAVSPWDAEVQRAAQLSSTWDDAKASPATLGEETSATEASLDSSLMTGVKEPVVETTEPATLEQPTEELSATESTYAAETLLSPVAEEIPHQEAAHIVSEQLPALQDSLPTETTVSGEPTPAPSTSTDEIVAKVLARMSPDVLQAVTREILKPLVEAMIKDELRKK